MDLVESILGSLKGIVLRLEAEVTEYLYGETMMGFSHTRIISGLINLYFLGASPMIFKPGMLFEGHVCQFIRIGNFIYYYKETKINISLAYIHLVRITYSCIVAQNRFVYVVLMEGFWNSRVDSK